MAVPAMYVNNEKANVTFKIPVEPVSSGSHSNAHNDILDSYMIVVYFIRAVCDVTALD